MDRARLAARVAGGVAGDGHEAPLAALAAALGPKRHTAVLRRLSPFPGRPVDDPITAAAVRPLLAARARTCGWDADVLAAAVLGEDAHDRAGAVG